MKRFLSIVTVLFAGMTLLTPVLELFDRWDKPGLGNDTELPLFLICLFVTLVLLVAVLLRRRLADRQQEVILVPIRYEMLWGVGAPVENAAAGPLLIPPLRI